MFLLFDATKKYVKYLLEILVGYGYLKYVEFKFLSVEYLRILLLLGIKERLNGIYLEIYSIVYDSIDRLRYKN